MMKRRLWTENSSLEQAGNRYLKTLDEANAKKAKAGKFWWAQATKHLYDGASLLAEAGTYFLALEYADSSTLFLDENGKGRYFEPEQFTYFDS
jgi:hypothetical protein